MELKQIKELMTMMERTGTKRLLLKREEYELQLEREDNKTYKLVDSSLELYEENPLRNEMALRRSNILSSRATNETPSILNMTPSIKETDSSNSTYIASPMVGTFYTAAAAGEPVFVKVGDKVEKDTPVCIIEAMKVMNEVKAGVNGIIAEILVENNHPVEFGTKLFRISQS